MESSTILRASPLCLDLTFPSGATQEEEEEKEKKQKTESSKASGSFFVMSPSRQCVCMHISDPGRDRHKDKYIQHTHTQMYRHTLRKRTSSQDH